MRALTPWEELIGVGYRELEVSREEGWKEKLLLEYKRKKKKTSEGVTSAWSLPVCHM